LSENPSERALFRVAAADPDVTRAMASGRGMSALLSPVSGLRVLNESTAADSSYMLVNESTIPQPSGPVQLEVNAF
jgi:hypothetical protein